MNYTGGKYKLLPQLFPLFPEKYTKFIDLFAGGAVVSVNVALQKDTVTEIVVNDLNKQVIDFYGFLSNCNEEGLLNNLRRIIQRYELSDTFLNGLSFMD